MNGRLLITALLNICFLTVSSKGLSGQESQDAFSSFYGSPVVSPTVMKGNLLVVKQGRINIGNGFLYFQNFRPVANSDDKDCQSGR